MSDFDLNRDELLETFAAEAAEDVVALEAGLLALEAAPHDAAITRELLRRAHTLKGNASCVGQTALSEFAHKYEEVLEQAQRGEVVVDSALITKLLMGIDRFRALLDGRDEGEHARPAEEQARRSTSLRVASEKLNRMLNLAGEIAIARGRVWQLDSIEEVIEVERELDALHNELQELIMRARMVPVGPLFHHYARMVRDLAASHGKNARLVTIGDDVELDTTAVESLRDPLTHMIRNAIDHGLETSAERIARGKSPVGHITLHARHHAGRIVIRVSDDGAGLDHGAIAVRAASLGLDVERLSPAELDRLIFESGFSTAGSVTDLSGRGVGMDVVRRAIESLRGTIGIETREGEGTAFTIRLPLTLAMIDGFNVSAANENYLVPMESVVECLELPANEPRDTTTGVLLLRDEIIPYVRLRRLLDLGGTAPERENVLVVQCGDAKAGLAVDALHGATQAVLKPLGNYFGDLPGVAGSSILGSGRVALVLDVPQLLNIVEGVIQ